MEVGVVTAGLVTLSFSRRTVAGGRTSSQSLAHTGEEYSYTRQQQQQEGEGEGREEQTTFSLDSMADFISGPAGLVLEKLFAQRRGCEI